MKKILSTMLLALAAAFTFTSCEDVPAPYDTPTSGGGDKPGTTEVAEGDGSLTSPYNPIAVTNYIKTLEDGATSADYVYIKGTVSTTKEISAKYGNASFYISADGTTDGTQFYVYRIKGLGNKNIASDDEIKVGDEVIVYAKVINFSGNTPETVQGEGWLYSLNGKTDSGSDNPSTSTATGDGTKENPFNSVAANEYTSKLDADAKSDKKVYIKGKVVSVKEQYGTQYGNATFYISDDGTENGQFYVFRALYLNNEKYTAGTTLTPGDDVVVCGTVTNFKGNTPETVQGEAYLVSLTSNGGGEQPGGETEGDFEYVVANCGLENQTALSTLTLTDGLTLTFAAGGNSNGPKYYTTGNTFRMYPKNSVTFTSTKNIVSVTIVCDEYNGTVYNASGSVSTNSGSVATSGSDINVTGISSKEFTLTDTSTTTGAASQIRIKKIIVKYSK